MAPRSSWKGFIKLSLVSVPVKAFTANNTSEEIRLNQLHKDCNTRVKYQKVCPEHGELSSDQIVSGYEFQKGQYVVIDPQEVSKLRKESDRSISIRGFVKPEAVDPIYYAGRTYYLLPEGIAGGRPYALLHRGMADANFYAIANVVIAGREQLVPERLGLIGRHPYLVTEIPGKTGSRNHDLAALEVEMHQAEGFERFKSVKPHARQDAVRRRSLDCERRDIVGLERNVNIEADCCRLQPGEMALL